MDLGWCDVCLRVKSVSISRKFYEGLGFWKVEGKDEDRWAVITNGDLRLGVFEEKYMGDDAISLNFRGSDIGVITKDLNERGYSFEAEPKLGDNGSGSARMRDPDGYAIFFDTAPCETKKELPAD